MHGVHDPGDANANFLGGGNHFGGRQAVGRIHFDPVKTGIFRTLEPVFQGLAPGHAELASFAVLELRISIRGCAAAATVGVGAAVEAGVIVEAVRLVVSPVPKLAPRNVRRSSELGIGAPRVYSLPRVSYRSLLRCVDIYWMFFNIKNTQCDRITFVVLNREHHHGVPQPNPSLER